MFLEILVDFDFLRAKRSNALRPTQLRHAYQDLYYRREEFLVCNS